jgi:hypothetical protein
LARLLLNLQTLNATAHEKVSGSEALNRFLHLKLLLLNTLMKSTGMDTRSL